MSRPIIRLNRPGFTMVELLVVIVIIALLLALLLPAINGAVRSARNAAVSAEINQLSQALADFKSKYGDYPPSRILLSENGFYDTTDTTYISAQPSKAYEADINYGQLAQRSVSYLRKFWPKVAVSTSAPIFPGPSYPNGWYDFNGNVGTTSAPDPPYILEGQEALVFFLGGIPTLTTVNGKPIYGVSGFSKDPSNPFIGPNATGSPAVRAAANNRSAPLFEFNPGRLVMSSGFQGPNHPQIPGYVDSLGDPNTEERFYAYFCAYGNNSYDPNDVNFDTGNHVESDAKALSPLTLSFHVNFPVENKFGSTNLAASPAPNPYTSTLTAGNTVPTYQSPNTFQILSPGVDGEYGLGGLFSPSSAEALPAKDNAGKPINMGNSNDMGVRTREKDNLTNFRNGRLD